MGKNSTFDNHGLVTIKYEKVGIKACAQAKVTTMKMAENSCMAKGQQLSVFGS